MFRVSIVAWRTQLWNLVHRCSCCCLPGPRSRCLGYLSTFVAGQVCRRPTVMVARHSWM
jgi:hypothetical protein